MLICVWDAGKAHGTGFYLIVELHASQLSRIVPAGLDTRQGDCLVAAQAAGLVDGMRVDAAPLQIRLSAHDEERLCLMQSIEAGKIDVAPIHHIETARPERDLVEGVHIVSYRAVPYYERSRDFERLNSAASRKNSQ